MKKWEKHNVLQLIQKENLNNFTLESLRQLAQKQGNAWFYATDVSNFLFELSMEGKIKATYVSKGTVTIAIYSKNEN